MRAVLQRVVRPRVTVDGRVAGEIGRGLCVLVAVESGDATADAERLGRKIARLRIFEGDDGRFARSVVDAGGDALVVSNFTLAADSAKGNRPSFSRAAAPEEAAAIVEALCAALRGSGVPVATGEFGARMAVELVNDGPVTLVL